MEKKIKLACPECHQEFNANIYTSINVQLDKDIKIKVLSGTLFDIECEYCHSKFHIPYPVLYHDMEKKLLIQFTEEKDLDSEGVYKQVEKVFMSDIKQDYIIDANWAVSNTK